MNKAEAIEKVNKILEGNYLTTDQQVDSLVKLVLQSHNQQTKSKMKEAEKYLKEYRFDKFLKVGPETIYDKQMIVRFATDFHNSQLDKLDEYFKSLRFDKNHHLGLGDIRLTIGQQEEILNKLIK